MLYDSVFDSIERGVSRHRRFDAQSKQFNAVQVYRDMYTIMRIVVRILDGNLSIRR